MIENKPEPKREKLTLKEENRRLRLCAIKYLTWLDVRTPEKGLEHDLFDPEMLAP